MRPFLKWAGNKYSIITRVIDVLPQKARRLIEPFAGSGAVSLNTHYPDYLLADANPDLITLFQLIQSDGNHFIDFCEPFFTVQNNHRDRFYELRHLFNTTQDSHLKSALFLYLNRHGYNGLCRYNANGLFNVPFGRYKKPYFPRKEMQFFHEKSGGMKFKCADFSAIIKSAKAGDVVYCDPPYVPLSATAYFTSYHQHQFGWDQQCKLVAQAEAAAARGVTVIISNHSTPAIKKLYSQAKLRTFPVRRTISCKSSSRGEPAREVLAVFAP